MRVACENSYFQRKVALLQLNATNKLANPREWNSRAENAKRQRNEAKLRLKYLQRNGYLATISFHRGSEFVTYRFGGKKGPMNPGAFSRSRRVWWNVEVVA